MIKAIFKASLTAVLLFSTCVICRADEEEIREAIKEYVAAFNEKNLEAIAKLWTADATHVDHELGERTVGRNQIIADIKQAFESESTLRLSGAIDTIRMIKSDVAIVEGKVSISDGPSEPTSSKFTAVLVKEDDHWAISSLEEMPLVFGATAGEVLSQLEWLVGNWKDDSVESSVRWAGDGNFLVRSCKAIDGDESSNQSTQIIGYDPSAGQIRSWAFNSDGSFGEGFWNKSGSTWEIKSIQTLTDGRAASGVYLMEPKGTDAFTIQLLGHEIDGEPMPSTEAVEVKRISETDMPAASTQTPKP